MKKVIVIDCTVVKTVSTGRKEIRVGVVADSYAELGKKIESVLEQHKYIKNLGTEEEETVEAKLHSINTYNWDFYS